VSAKKREQERRMRLCRARAVAALAGQREPPQHNRTPESRVSLGGSSPGGQLFQILSGGRRSGLITGPPNEGNPPFAAGSSMGRTEYCANRVGGWVDTFVAPRLTL